MGNSRIRLQPLSDLNPDREIYVGWDEGLQTYYAQVFDGQDEQGEDRLTVDVGNDLGDITYPGGVISALRPYADITDDLGELLNISRVSTTPTYTDLRADSRAYQQHVHLDDRRHGVDSREELERLLDEGSPEPEILTPGSEERVDELLTGILADDEAHNHGRRLDAAADAGSDEPWFDGPPSDDEGFHSGLGT